MIKTDFIQGLLQQQKRAFSLGLDSIPRTARTLGIYSQRVDEGDWWMKKSLREDIKVGGILAEDRPG